MAPGHDRPKVSTGAWSYPLMQLRHTGKNIFIVRYLKCDTFIPGVLDHGVLQPARIPHSHETGGDQGPQGLGPGQCHLSESCHKVNTKVDDQGPQGLGPGQCHLSESRHKINTKGGDQGTQGLGPGQCYLLESRHKVNTKGGDQGPQVLGPGQ